jgi:hypothetical protein
MSRGNSAVMPKTYLVPWSSMRLPLKYELAIPPEA